jgi:hypothetical protein
VSNPVVAYLVIFTPVLAIGLAGGWLARGRWDKTGRTVDRLATRDAADDPLRYQEVLDMLRGKGGES